LILLTWFKQVLCKTVLGQRNKILSWQIFELYYMRDFFFYLSSRDSFYNAIFISQIYAILVTQKLNTFQDRAMSSEFVLEMTFFTSEDMEDKMSRIRRGKDSAPCALESVVIDWLNSCVTCTWVTIYCRHNKQLFRLLQQKQKKGFFSTLNNFV
jgi:hypothetical protein